jgi:hypothetical protein
MVSMYSSILPAAWLFSAIGRRLKPLPLVGVMLFAAPMVIDGFSHLISDLAGVEQGFRQNNLWLVKLTAGIFPSDFYVGNSWGSLNAWMRLITGALFGAGLTWYFFSFPKFDTLPKL